MIKRILIFQDFCHTFADIEQYVCLRDMRIRVPHVVLRDKDWVVGGVSGDVGALPECEVIQ